MTVQVPPPERSKSLGRRAESSRLLGEALLCPQGGGLDCNV